MLCAMCGNRESADQKEVCNTCDFEIEVQNGRIEGLTEWGHTFHCASRIVFGDGECECQWKRTKEADPIYFCSPEMIPGYRPFTMEHMVQCFSRIDYSGLITGDRRRWLLPPRYEVVCPNCNNKTNLVLDYLGRLLFTCRDCYRSW